MSVTLNGNGSTPQPSGLREELSQIQHDNEAIDGSLQRDRTGQKKQATLNWDKLSTADYQTLIAMFTAGTSITYANSASDYAGGSLSFTGLPTFTEGDYTPGSSLVRSISAVIREV